MAGKVIKLVARQVSEETIRALEYLLQEARAGVVIGFACVAMCSADEYFVDATGPCRSRPHLARGMIATLDDELAHLIVEPKRA